MSIELVNAVAGGELGNTLDLYDLSLSLTKYSPNYEPEVSPGLYFELPDTEVTVMVFSSGEYHLTGGNSIRKIWEDYREIVDILGSELSIEINPSEPEIRNLVYRGNFNREFDLSEIAGELSDCNYDPETYPGLYYSKKGIQMTVYRTGKFTVTGATNRKEAEELTETFRESTTD